MSFIFKITTTTSPQTFVIPCVDEGTFNATVDYGDGTGSQTVTAYNDSNLTHSFATAGQHTITIDGTFPNIRFYDDAASREALDEVVDLGDVGWVTFYRAFRDCTNLTTFNSGTANTSSVTSMQQMFHTCTNLTALNVNSFDTSSVTNMQAMFHTCTNLTTLDVSNFDTSSVSNMNNMFNNCSSLTSLNVSNFDTSSVSNMNNMFLNCTGLTSLDLSNFDTSSVTGMEYMFLNCTSLTTLDVSKFNTSSVTDISRMFLNCTSLTNLDIKHFDISSVTNGTSFLQGANNALTTTAYDELLDAWAVQDVQPNVAWHFGDAQYTVVNIADWYSPRGASSLSIINNKLVSIADSTATFGVAQQIDNLVVGSVYSFIATATCNNNSATVSLVVSASADVTSPIFNKQAAGGVTANDTFTATATTLYVGVIVSGHAANDTVTIDAGITFKEIANYTEANAASEIEYSQENVFGSELVVNGDFTTGWSINSTFSVVDKVLSYTLGSQGDFHYTPPIPFVVGNLYAITYKISNNVEGSLSVHHNASGGAFSGNEGVYAQTPRNGTYTEIREAIREGSLIFHALFFKGSISEISVKEITNAVTYQNIAQDVRDTYTLDDDDTWVGR